MPSTFVFNPAVVPYLEAGGAGVAEKIKEKGEEVLRKAQALCPVNTGTLQASLEEHTALEDGKIASRVGTDVEYAPYVEFGTSDTPAFAFLRRALDG